MNLERAYLGFCWFPPAVYGIALYFVGQYEGWGQWAAAPLLLPPLALCLGWIVAGAALLWRSGAGSRQRSLLGGAALVGGSPALILILRALTS